MAYLIKDETLTGIADAIRTKKSSEETIKCEDFANEIENLPSTDLNDYFNIHPTAEELETTTQWIKNNYIKKVGEFYIPSSITNISYLCASSTQCPKVICGNQVTNMEGLYKINYAKYIDVSGLDVTNVTNLKQMFSDCPNLVELDLSSLHFDNSPSGSHGELCTACNLLLKVTMPFINSGNAYRFFRSCSSLKTLIIQDDRKVYSYNRTLDNCYHMDGTVNATYNPEGLKDGRIYVPDSLVNSYKKASGWSTYADQILPLSELPEGDD